MKRCILCRAVGKHIATYAIQTKERIHLGFVEVISPHKGVIRKVFLANHLATTDN